MAPTVSLTVDCRDAAVMVAFWQPLLGYHVAHPPHPFATWRDWYLDIGVPAEEIVGDGADRLAPPHEAHGVNIWFQQVPEPKSGKNRLHLDLHVSGGPSVERNERRRVIEVAVADVEARGGTFLRWNQDDAADHVGAVMADPEGNEFCIA